MTIVVCSFCSNNEPSVQVICEGKCLICSKCIHVPTIKTLLVNYYFSIASLHSKETSGNNMYGSVYSNNDSSVLDLSTKGGGCGTGQKGGCPLCLSPLARSMIQVVSTIFKTDNNKQNDETIYDVNTRYTQELDLNLVPNELQSFLKKFRLTYIMPPKVGDTAVNEDDEFTNVMEYRSSSSSNNAKLPIANNGNTASRPATTSSLKRPSTQGSDTRQGTMSMMSKKNTKKDLAHEDETEYINDIRPTKITNPVVVVDFYIDVCCSMWVAYCKDRPLSAVAAAVKMCSSKKQTQRTNDFKLKSIIEYFICSKNALPPTLYMFGRLLGLVPVKASTVRPAWSIIAMLIYTISHCDRSFKINNATAAAGATADKPTASELKQKLSGAYGSYKEKMVPLKRALKIIEYLFDSNEAYWNLTPFTSCSVEYNSILPWTDDSKARLLHLLLHVTTDASSSGSGTVRRIHQGDESTQRHPIFSGSNTPEPGSRSSMKRHAEVSSSGNDTSMPPLMHSSTSTNNVSSKASGSSYDPRLKTIESKARQLWDCTVTSATSYHVYGHVRNKSISMLRLTDPHVLDFASKSIISIGKLALVCIEAWENEYNMLKTRIQRSSITRVRKQAFASTFDSNATSFNNIEKLALLRIIHYYRSTGSVGIDWHVVKDMCYKRGFPFNVPMTICDRSNAELNYVVVMLDKIKSSRYQQEMLEDILTADGPYSHVILNSLMTDGDGTFGLRTSSHESILSLLDKLQLPSADSGIDDTYPTTVSRDRRDDISRGQFLACQSIGDGIDANGDATVYDTATMNPTSYPVSSAVALPLSMVPDDSVDNMYRKATPSTGIRTSRTPYDATGRNSLSGTTNISAFDSSMVTGTVGVNIPINSFGDDNALLAYMEGTSSSIVFPDTAGGGIYPCSTTAEEGHFLQDAAHIIAASNALTASAESIRQAKISSYNNSGYHHDVVTPIDISYPLRNPSRSAVPLAKIPYASPLPARNEVNFVDVMSIKLNNSSSSSSNVSSNVSSSSISRAGVEILTKIKMLSSTHRNSSNSSSTTDDLDHELFGFMQTDSKVFGYNSNHDLLRPSTTPANVHVDLLLLSNTCTTAGATSAGSSSGLTLSMAKNRVKLRVAGRSNCNASIDAADRVLQRSQSFKTNKCSSINTTSHDDNTMLDISNYVGVNADSIESTRSGELQVVGITLIDTTLTTVQFKHVVDRYFNDWQLQSIKKLYLVNNQLETPAAKILGDALATTRCFFTHVNISGNKFSDIAIRSILYGIKVGGGCDTLVSLIMSHCNIVFAIDSLEIFSSFVNLTELDISYNNITMDIKKKTNIIANSLRCFCRLQRLSISHNRIKDDGFRQLYESISCMNQLQTLDISYTFITNKCYDLIKTFIDHSKKKPKRRDGNQDYIDGFEYTTDDVDDSSSTFPKLTTLKMDGHLLNSANISELKYISQNKSIRIIYDNEE